MRKKLLFVLASFALVFALLGVTACGGEEKPPQKDETAPVITVNGTVPETGVVGYLVTLPAATATDDVDGDLTSSVKVTVALLKADGTVQMELLYERAANVETSFTPTSNTLFEYKITYSVKDAAGNKGIEEFNFTAEADTVKPELTLNEDSLPGFTLSGGVTGKAAADLVLPSATAIDDPGSVDISERVSILIYEKIGGTVSSDVFAQFTGAKETPVIRLPQGSYVAVYEVEDAAGNRSDDRYEFPVEVGAADAINLARDSKNFAFEDRIGMSWINEYGELSFGHIPEREPLDQTVGFSLNTTKIYDQIVAVSFNADVPDANGQQFYTLSARGSKDGNSLPNAETCTWPSYLFLRISKGRIESRTEKSCDKEMTTVRGYDGSLMDGQDHVLYIQWKSEGSSAEAADAAIMIYGWVDTDPSVGYENASFIFKCVSGASNGSGTLAAETFIELWNETGAGWFSMDTYCPVTSGFQDDYMRIRGLAVYENGTTDFNVDIEAPVITAEFDAEAIYANGEEITVPNYVLTGAETGTISMISPSGVSTEVEVGQAFIPNENGQWKLLYSATDEAGNFGYKAFVFSVSTRDMDPPVLTISDKTPITVGIDELVTIPMASANDDVDGDLSDQISVELIGPQHEYLTMGGEFYPMTVGTYEIRYSVRDAFGNLGTDSVTLTVTGGTQGNMLTEDGLTSSANGVGLRGSEYIYEQKVSMILNIQRLNSLVMFNLRGPIGTNSQWPTGMVLRILQNGDITVSAQGHDSAIFGLTNYSLYQYWLGVDILFEYQVETVTINDTDYIRVRLWIQGEEMTFQVNGPGGGQVGLEPDSKAIYRAVSLFTGAQSENIYSTPFWISTNESIAIVKELRIDGVSCEKPVGPQVPDGLEMPVFNTGDKAFMTEAHQMGLNDDSFKVGQYSNEDLISISFRGEDKGAVDSTIFFNIIGSYAGWSGGLMYRLSKDGLYLYAGGANGDDAKLVQLNAFPYNDGVNANSYTLVYRLTYNREGSVVRGITVETWFGLTGQTLQKLSIQGTPNSSYVSETEAGKVVIGFEALGTNAQIVPGDITCFVLGALNTGGTVFTVEAASQLEVEPGMEDVGVGYEKPTNDNDFTALLSAPAAIGPGDTSADLAENANEDYVSITFNGQAAEKGCIIFNVLGSYSGWNGGLMFKISKDGFFIMAGMANGGEYEMAQLKAFPYNDGINGTSYTLVYKLTYLERAGLCYAVRVEVWFGDAGGTLEKLGNQRLISNNCTYNEAEGAFDLSYEAFNTAADFTPGRITAVCLGALNGETCQWTVTEIKTVARPE